MYAWKYAWVISLLTLLVLQWLRGRLHNCRGLYLLLCMTETSSVPSEWGHMSQSKNLLSIFICDIWEYLGKIITLVFSLSTIKTSSEEDPVLDGLQFSTWNLERYSYLLVICWTTGAERHTSDTWSFLQWAQGSSLSFPQRLCDEAKGEDTRVPLYLQSP